MKEVYNLPDAKLEYYLSFIAKEEATKLFKELLQETAWQQDKITLFGKTHLQPRLTALFSSEAKTYTYSGIKMEPVVFPPKVLYIKNAIEKVSAANFNTCLVNLYRYGSDSNGWHADDEKELGKNPVIASLSLGAIRKFKLKHNFQKDQKIDFMLQPGSLLLMKGSTQHYWKHQIPKTKKAVGQRINLTFRNIK